MNNSNNIIAVSAVRHLYHQDEIVRLGIGKANELESVKMRLGSIGDNKGIKKEEILKNAAEIYAKAGDLKKYCLLMVELGEWERAIAIAPSIGYDFWQELTKKYGKVLAGNLDENCIPFFLAGGAVRNAVEFYGDRNESFDAVMIAKSFEKSNCHGGESRNHNYNNKQEEGKNGRENEDDEGEDTPQDLLKSTHCRMAEDFSQDDKLILAAASHFAVQDNEKGVEKLLKGKNHLLAFCVASSLGVSVSEIMDCMSGEHAKALTENYYL